VGVEIRRPLFKAKKKTVEVNEEEKIYDKDSGWVGYIFEANPKFLREGSHW
jgi:hypothetical protein